MGPREELGPGCGGATYQRGGLSTDPPPPPSQLESASLEDKGSPNANPAVVMSNWTLRGS
jgi:hypothetical protein